MSSCHSTSRTSPDSLTLRLHSSLDDVTRHDDTSLHDDTSRTCLTTDKSGFSYLDQSPVDNVDTPSSLDTPVPSAANKIQNISCTADQIPDQVRTEAESTQAPTVVLNKTNDSVDATLDRISNGTLDSLSITLGTLDLTLEAEMEKLGRWSRDFSTLEGVKTLDGVEVRWSRDFTDLVPLSGERVKSPLPVTELLADEVVCEPWRDISADVTDCQPVQPSTCAPDAQPSTCASDAHVLLSAADACAALESDEHSLNDSDTFVSASEGLSTSRSITHVSTFSLDTLEVQQETQTHVTTFSLDSLDVREVVRHDAIKSDAGFSAKDHSLKLTQALSFGRSLAYFHVKISSTSIGLCN